LQKGLTGGWGKWQKEKEGVRRGKTKKRREVPNSVEGKEAWRGKVGFGRGPQGKKGPCARSHWEKTLGEGGSSDKLGPGLLRGRLLLHNSLGGGLGLPFQDLSLNGRKKSRVTKSGWLRYEK